jgi:HEAT repeat protein
MLGLFAARALALAGDTDAVPVLRDVIRSETSIFSKDLGAHLRIAAAAALVRLGHPEELCTLVDHLAFQVHEAQDTMPSVLIELARRHPDDAVRCLERGLASASPLEREMSAWVAGAVPLAPLAPVLRRVADGGDTPVRIAAVWALGRLRDGQARAVLARLADAPDAELRAFAVEALGRLGRAEASS